MAQTIRESVLYCKPCNWIYTEEFVSGYEERTSKCLKCVSCGKDLVKAVQETTITHRTRIIS